MHHLITGGPIVLGKRNGGMLKPVTQVGVASFVRSGCSVPGFPSVFARVSTEFNWITSTVCQITGELCGPRPGPTAKAAKDAKRLRT